MLMYQLKSNIGKKSKKTVLLDLPQAPFNAETEEGKRAIFLRSLKASHFKENTRVRKPGERLCGTIIEIIQDIDHIQWTERGIPLYIVVKWDNNETLYHNPFQLTYKRAR